MKQSVHVLFLFVFALFGLVSGPAQAQTGHVYIGASAGSTSFNTSAITISSNLDESSTGYKVFAGYYLSPTVAVEMSYADLGAAKVTGNYGAGFIYHGLGYIIYANNWEAKLEGTLVGVGGMFKFPVSPVFNLHARLGLASWNVDQTISAPGYAPYTESDSGTDPYYGAGLGWEFVRTVSLNADYEHYELGSDSVNFVSVGIAKRF